MVGVYPPMIDKEWTTERWTLSEMLRRIAAFLRWLLSSDQLPDAPNGDDTPRPRTPGFTRWLLTGSEPLGFDVARSKAAPDTRALGLFASDVLPERRPRPHRSDVGFLSGVLSSEICPHREPTTSPMQAGFLSYTLRQERCPETQSAGSQGHGGVLRWLASREICPTVEAQVPGRRRTWLRWLLSREDL